VLTKRIIACLDVDDGRVVKGVQFRNLRDAGDPAECAAAHARDGADEIVLLDITATSDKRRTMLDVISRTARGLFIPFTVGGGIRELSDAAAVFEAGADKKNCRSFWLAGGSGGHRCQAGERWFRGVRCRRARSDRPGRASVGAGGSRLRGRRNPAYFNGPRRDAIWF
jgi:Histidine biosynthesis protein